MAGILEIGELLKHGEIRKSTLLETTPIESSDDIHFIVGKVKTRAHSWFNRLRSAAGGLK